jgi:ABC-type xylose transport system permease subunit
MFLTVKPPNGFIQSYDLSAWQAWSLELAVVRTGSGASPTIGIAMVMITRQIDISVGSQFGLCAVLAGNLLTGGLSLPLALPLAATAGAAMGALNGCLVQVKQIVIRTQNELVFECLLMVSHEGNHVHTGAIRGKMAHSG